MPVPVLDLRAQYDAIKTEIDTAISGVLESSEFVLGKVVAGLEASIASYSGCAHGIGVNSGTDALLLALMAAEVGPGDEVITTPFSFIATANTISRTGASPIFVDIEPDTFNLDATKVEQAISNQTKAIVPVHLYGHPADMDPLLEIAAQYGLHVIEDAAQAIGALYKGKKVGSIGGMGCLSFYPTKNLGAYGDAGMVVTNDASLAEKVDVLRRHGSKVRYSADIVGVNSRLDALQAAILMVKLKHIDNWNARRRAIADKYASQLRGLPLTLPTTKSYAEHVFHQYTIQTERRDELADFLNHRGIGSMIYYPIPIHRQTLYSDRGFPAFPNTDAAAERVLSLPMYPELTEGRVNAVTTAIRGFFDGTAHQ